MNTEPERLGRGFYWEDLRPGARYLTYGRTITAADIGAFVGLAGMIEILFTNAEYRRTEAAIKGDPAPGALVFSVAEALVLNATAQETGLAFLGLSVLDVHAPVLANDTIEVEIEILEVRKETRGTRGLVRTRNIVRNQRHEAVLSYEPLRLMQGGPCPTSGGDNEPEPA